MLFDDDDDDINDQTQPKQKLSTTELEWVPSTGTYLQNFEFSELTSGFSAEYHEAYYDKTAFDFYRSFLNDEILDLMVSLKENYTYTLLCTI